MSRKDYIAIGSVLAGQWNLGNPVQRGTVWCITLSVADVFKQDNERFDRARFYEYVFGTSDQFGARNLCKFQEV